MQIGPAGQMAKVTAVSEDGSGVHSELRNGFSGWIDQPDEEYAFCGTFYSS